MRDPLHSCIGRAVLGAALAGATLAGAALTLAVPAQAQGKVIRSEAADRMPNPGIDASTRAAPPAIVNETSVKPEAAVKPAAKGKSSADPNAPEPLSERAQAALDRAKQALADEAMEDAVPEQPPQAQAPAATPAQPIVGQAVKLPPKSASASAKPAVKCMAGC
jgi:hypothetical protein